MVRRSRRVWPSAAGRGMSVCLFFSSRRRHTRFDCDWSSDVCSSDLLKGDPLQLQEAVVNLVKNAIDATDRGSVQVRLEERPGSYAIVITDTGIGMSPDVLARVFDPTYTTKPRGEGLGLGLPLADRKSVV